jgi:hypothetical protein
MESREITMNLRVERSKSGSTCHQRQHHLGRVSRSRLVGSSESIESDKKRELSTSVKFFRLMSEISSIYAGGLAVVLTVITS